MNDSAGRDPSRTAVLYQLADDDSFDSELTPVVCRRPDTGPGQHGATVGRDFLPYLDEGSIWLQVQLPPGLSLSTSSKMAGELRDALTS